MSDQNGTPQLSPGVPRQLTTEEIAFNDAREMFHNVMSLRAGMFNSLMDPRRDLNDECGYPRGWVSPEALRDLHDYDPVAARVNEVFVRACWQAQPTVYEDKNSDTKTEFEQAWDELGSNLVKDTPESWYKDERGNPIWEYLIRADLLSGVAYYGILFLGLDDGQTDLAQPARPKKGMKLTHMRVYPQWQAQVAEWDNTPGSPRRGRPVAYNLQTYDSAIQQDGAGPPTEATRVHWTRCIHLADTHHHPMGNEVYAMPRTRPVWNDIYNLQKIAGAAGEGYWKSAFMGLALKTIPQLGANVKIDKTGLRDMMEQYQNGLQRYLALAGMEVDPIAPEVVDPTPFVDQAIRRICIKIRCPKRKFEGSERGELASSEDDGDWLDQLAERNVNYTTPKVIVPFTDRLIWLGVLPTPQQYSCDWPDLTKKTDAEKSDVALKITQALSAYVQGGVEGVVPPLDYLTRVLGWDEEDAQETLEAAAGLLEEQMAGEGGGSPLLSMVGGLTGVSELFKAAKDGAMSEETLKQLLMMFFKVDEATADKIIADGLPEPPPTPEPGPLSVKPGEALVHPETGKVVGKSPFSPKPAGPPK